MASLLVIWLVVAFAIFATSRLLPGMEVKNYKVALVAAIVMGIVNALIRPVVAFLAFPVTFLTFGLFAWVINGIMLMLVAKIVPDFKVNGCLTAILGSLLISLISAGVMHLLPYSA
jgi:putative membrane protein